MLKRYLYVLALALTVVTALVIVPTSAGMTSAAGPNQSDYPPGSVVTITGDNSNAAGYVAGEAVHVDATGPNSTSLSCDATADENGAWSCDLTLAADAPAGDYAYMATGVSSGVSESGAFTVSVPPSPISPPWVQADQPEYNAGGTVSLTGGGWQPFETVQIVVNDELGQTWSLQDTVQADFSGAVSYQFDLPNWFVAKYDVAATGEVSGSVANTSFTDSVTSISPTTAAEGGTSFTLTVNGAGFNSTSQVTWTPPGGVARTLTRLTQSTTRLTATVLSSDLPNEGTATVRVINTGAGGPVNFTIGEADSFTLTPQTITATTNTAFNGTVATLADSFDNQNPSEFAATINWGDGSAATSGSVTRTGTGQYTVTGAHTYTSQFLSTTVKTAFANGASTIPVANNGTTNFASAGSIMIFTGSGYQMLSYTGKTTGTSASFTGVTGWSGSGTIAAGNPITQAFAATVTVTDPAPGTATATTTSPTEIADGVSYALTASNFNATEGAVYTGSSPFWPGSIGTSVFPNAGEYRLLVQVGTGGGAQSAWYTLYTSGPNNYMYPNSTPGSISIPDEGSVSYTDTLYRNNGAQVATGGGTITAGDAQLGYYNAINSYPTLIGVPTGPIQVGKFIDYLPGDNHGDFTVSVHWGDGTSDTGAAVFAGNNGSNQATYTVTGSHTYTAAGTYQVTYDAIDDGGMKEMGIHTATVVVTALSTSTSVVSSSNPSTYGDPVTFTATVANTSTSTPPTGAVDFRDGPTDLGTGSFVSSSGNQSSWKLTTMSTTLGAGTHSIAAVFTGNAFLTSTGTMTQTVNQKTLTITASSASVIYGAPAPTITASYAGFVTGDTWSNSLSTLPICTTTYVQGSGVGGSPYGTSCSGAVSTNYSPSYKPGSVSVGPATLTVTADSKSHQYSDPPPPLTYQITGFVLGETPSVVSGTANCSTTGTQWVQAGQYPITCNLSGLGAANYMFVSAMAPYQGTMTVTQEDAASQYTGDTIAQVGTSLNLRATVWDSAAAGFPGTPTGPVPDATVGDIGKIWIAFDVYPASSCLSGTPTTTYAQVTDTGTAGDGIGTASTTYSSSAEASFCVVSRLVASGGAVNPWYKAPAAEAAGIDFYVNSGQFATGGGWINDSNGGKGNYGFNARYNNSGKPQGQFVYVYRGTYNGVAADFVIKSNALTALQFTGSNYPISSTLQGKASIQINRAGDGVALSNDGNATFTATVLDSGQSSGIGSDKLALTVFDKNGVTYKSVPTAFLGGGNVVIHLK
jgi:hypothetical protein